MISMDKQYRTRDGRKVRVLCVDRGGSFPVVALVGLDEDLESFSKAGEYRLGKESPEDLIEHHPAQDWPVNHPIWVRDSGESAWYPRHFAKYKDGLVYTWKDGGTSHTTQYTSRWDQGTDVNPNQEK